MLTEPEAFTHLIVSIDQAKAACNTIALYRSDQPWGKIADLLEQVKENARQLAMRGLN